MVLTIGIRAMTKDNDKLSSVSLQYPMLTKTNYAAWAIKMKVFLKAQGVWEAIDAKSNVDVSKDQMALAAIYQAINEDTLMRISEKETAKDAWEMIKTMFLGEEHVMEARIQTLQNELDVMRMKEGESIDDFSTRMMTTIAKIRGLGEKMEDSYIVKKLLRALSSKFIYIASTIEQFGDLKMMSVEELIDRLKAHEERVGGFSNDEHDEQLLLTKAEWRAREAKAGGQKKKKFDKSKIRCYNCQKYGHFADECSGKEKDHDEEEPALL